VTAGPRLHDAHYASFRYQKEDKLHLIKSPTLLIYGTEDLFYPKRELVSKLISRCQIKIIQNSGNVPALEQTTEFAQAILDFLKESVT
jgi:pimeloyl-ACP methyl ester carboxylesterase